MNSTSEAVRHPGKVLSHEERDACLHALGALHASGELSAVELDARIDAALSARTEDELAALVRTSSRLEPAAQEPTQTALPPQGAPRPRRTAGSLFALRFVVFAALMLLAGLVRVLILIGVALSVGTARALLATARVGSFAYQALRGVFSTRGALVGRAHAMPAPARLQMRRPATQELVVVPKAQVPAQREPVKIHPVLVPNGANSPSTALVLARRSTEVVRVEHPAVRREVLARHLDSPGRAFPREERRLRELVLQLQPLVHRVTYRARWRRSTTNACERTAQTNRWPRAIKGTRTAM
jgi:hypothetical protein